MRDENAPQLTHFVMLIAWSQFAQRLELIEQLQAVPVQHKAVDWRAIGWHKVNQNLRRLQVRIVKATQPEVNGCETTSSKGRFKGLRWMK
jgi:hypothetical protein